MNKGELNGNAKLNATQVLDIKKRLAMGEKGSTLANEYGVGQDTITLIRKGRRWLHTRYSVLTYQYGSNSSPTWLESEIARGNIKYSDKAKTMLFRRDYTWYPVVLGDYIIYVDNQLYTVKASAYDALCVAIEEKVYV